MNPAKSLLRILLTSCPKNYNWVSLCRTYSIGKYTASMRSLGVSRVITRPFNIFAIPLFVIDA